MIGRIILCVTICIAPLMVAAQGNELRYGKNGFHGDFFESSSPSNQALILLGGAEGGNEFGNMMAPYFQARGYHVLSLAYFQVEGLPGQLEHVPLEFVRRAMDWLRSEHDGEISRIGLIGGSKGAELALVAATVFQGIDALVLLSPSSVVWQSINHREFGSVESSWMFNGRPLPFLKYDFSRGVERMYDFYATAIDNLDDDHSVIQAEKVDSPVLMVSGSQDKLWPSKRMSEMIFSRLQGKGFPHTVDHVNFEEAGHLLIHAAAFDDHVEWPNSEIFDALGGSVEKFEEIAVGTLEKIAEFLDHEL